MGYRGNREDWIDNIVKKVSAQYHGREVILWGKYRVSDLIAHTLKEEYGIEDVYYVDKDAAKIDNKQVFSTEFLYGKSNQYYVVIPLAFYQSVKDDLAAGGYIEGKDYYYFSDCIIQKKDGYYEDAHGNKIIGNYKGLKFAFSGFNSIIEIGANVCIRSSTVYIHSNSKILLRDNTNLRESNINIENESAIEIKEKCNILNLDLTVGNMSRILLGEGISIGSGSDWEIKDGAMLEIGDRGIFHRGIFRLCENAMMKIGSDFSIGDDYNFVLYENTKVFFGDDCMVSFGVYLRSNDGHSIFDINTKRNINSTFEISRERKVIVGNHVWIGMRATILYNARIGDGSILGAGSLIKGIISNNCIAAGIPAKTIRKDVAWSRKQGTNEIMDCGSRYTCLTK